MIRYTLSPAAERDLAEIWFYSADTWGPDQADRYIRAIHRDLAEAVPGAPHVRAIDDLWRIKSGHHLCIFHSKGDEIFVVRVLHERMDVARHLPG